MICSKCRKLDVEHFTIPKSEISATPQFLPEDDINAEEYRSDSSKDKAATIEDPITLRQAQLEEMVKNLKLKFSDSKTTRAKRFCILIIAPSSWSKRKIAKEFGTSRRIAKIAKRLLRFLFKACFPFLHSALDETVSIMRSFYKENSRIMPGTKDARRSFSKSGLFS